LSIFPGLYPLHLCTIKIVKQKRIDMNSAATAIWNGTVKDGNGNLTTQSNIITHAPYSFQSRLKKETGTNPEELLAAAHAGCFTMKLSADLTSAGFTPKELVTTAIISLTNGVISKSALINHANVPGITNEQFLKIAEQAKDTCPVSRAYNMEITLEAQLK
jgi:lipoyl-dependent peroxiredoxin